MRGYPVFWVPTEIDEEVRGEEAAPAGGEDGAPCDLIELEEREDGDEESVREATQAVREEDVADVHGHL
jgi:hypothetical protein